ncbi:LLM class F420-dependent oxidoreductase [Calidifontibacter sp. DB0510]|uniref:LLM class F420-dependent oxidoreductase n=1 Tax=Metallococcus carri TaxID=1656884 RepID=A0A967AXJ8_9MICO|nr:LLM class F420-dependent oxidoreductase [Metallococcus carri]NHN54831.1 LLM class F420-dependent oxidoreductase [Metallococcus carri]NOP37176.1 LLM class F420-dependent oxidoreductase [Calidifontibacter sp. DB2511S]
MRLGLNLGYWGTTGTDDLETMKRLVVTADELGYDVAWVAEAYGSDIPSLIGYLSASTPRLGWGSAIMQIPARSPAMTAMTAATLDRITEGRFHLGLGVSGPQVSEGWHGVRFADPLGRTREYVAIVRQALGRSNVEFHGEHFELPLPDSSGKALRLLLLPERSDLPIYLASIGPRNVRLTGEIADGWLGIFVSPEHLPEQLSQLREGRETAGLTLAGFDVCASAGLSVDDDLDVAADRLRGNAALYIGGMGSRQKNFYNALARRMGFADEADRVQDLYLARQHRDAAAAVPREFIEQTALVGDAERIAGRLRAYADAGVTTLNVSPTGDTVRERLDALRLVAELARGEGLHD